MKLSDGRQSFVAIEYRFCRVLSRDVVPGTKVNPAPPPPVTRPVVILAW